MADGNKSSILRSSLGVSAATFISRLCGLLRVRLEAEVLGGGELASGWFLAFKIPNLFRRLLGEGALGTALIPLIAQTEAESGTPQLRRELTVIFATLSLVLGVIVVLISGLALWGSYAAQNSAWAYLRTERMQLMFQLLPLLMPYAFFICLVGIVGAVLNYARVFFLPALGALSLNIFLIGGLAGAWYCAVDQTSLPQFLRVLAYLVVISGVVQLLGMLILLKIHGKFPELSWRSFHERGVVRRLWHLALPAMIANSALQISFVVDQFVASLVNAQGVASLNYVDRIIDLPIGIYAVALGGVLMARMSRSAAEGNWDELTAELNYSLRHVIFICVPIGFGILFFHPLLLRLICLGGNYTENDLIAAREVAMFYGLGVPVFCLVKLLQPAYYSRKMMTIPLYCTLAAITVNIVLNFALMKPFQQGGIALATTLSAVLNVSLLLYFLKKEGFALQWKQLTWTAVRSVFWSAVLGGLIYYFSQLWTPTAKRGLNLLYLTVVSGAFLGFYLLFSCLSRSPEVPELALILKRRKKIQ